MWEKEFSRGDTAESMFIVRYGKLSIESPDHRDIELGKGEIVGEMALLKHTKDHLRLLQLMKQNFLF